MTTGDYVLWFGALVFLVLMAGMMINLAKFAAEHATEDWGPGILFGVVFYLVLVAAVLSPTYYLVLNN